MSPTDGLAVLSVMLQPVPYIAGRSVKFRGSVLYIYTCIRGKHNVECVRSIMLNVCEAQCAELSVIVAKDLDAG